MESFLQASEIKEQERLTEKQRKAELNRLRKQFISVLIGFLFAVGLAIWAIAEGTRADDQAKLAHANERLAKQAEQKATRELFDSTVTHASLLTQLEDFAEARKRLNSSRPYDAEVDASRTHARDLLAGFTNIMGGEAQMTFTDSDGQPLPPLIGEVAIGPDGRWLAASGERGAIALFERASGRLVQKLKGHDENANQFGIVWDIVFHPERPWLFSAGDDNQIIWWQLPQNGQETQILQQWTVETALRALAIDPEGKTLVMWSR